MRRNHWKYQALAGAMSVLVPMSAAWAGYREQMGRARQSLEDAMESAQRAGGSCESVSARLQKAIDSLTEARRLTSADRMKTASAAVSDSGVAAVTANCPSEVPDQVREAAEALDLASQLYARERAKQAAEEPGATEQPKPAGPTIISPEAFARLLKSIRETKDEVYKGEVAKDALGRSGFTAQQLDAMLSEMESDVVKLDVVTVLAHAVVDPQNGKIVAQRFDAPELGQEAVTALQGSR